MQNHISKSIIAILFCTLTFVNQANSQAMYEMQNATVNDCEGVLTDSQEGPEPDQYDHNEDYTFTICVEDADEIILNFAFFATEQTFDILTIYEGPDKTGPVIAVLHGVIQPAPSFVIRNECVTLHFVSDDNIVANGWSMTWRVEIDEPKVPEMMITGAVDCPLGDVEIMFNCPVDCDLLDPANFGIIGPGNISVSDITALDCDPQTGEATKFKMSFTDSLRLPGTYRIAFMGQIQDACGEWHDISSSLIFVLSGCPIAVYIETSEWACLGDCGKVRAVIVGGTNNPYTYDWSHTTDNSEEVEICFDDTTTISVTVTDQVSFTTASATYTYYPLPNPNFLNPLGIDTFCSNRGNHTYQVDLAGGEFYSRIIPGGNRTNGLYQFWRWSNRTVTERDIIEYIAPNGCTVYDTIFIKPINAGSHEAACIGSNAFAVNGGRPVGGSWSGNHVSPNGSFDPTEVGEFTITYTAPNGCQASKIVRVTDDIVMPDVDTICGNGRFRLTADPFGGRWAGPQISNNYWGNLEAQNLPPNRSYTYFYNLMGCTDSMVIFIRGIYAGRDTAICVSEDFLVLQDTIGTWTGPGVYIPALKGFDISGLGVGRYDYTLEANGCIDRFRLYIEDVVIEEHQVLEFCQEDYWVDIQNYISIYPSGGDLIAPFLYDTLDTWFFNPSLMGPGDHLVVLEAYDCQDSVWINIEEYATIQDYSFCELESAVNLEAIPAGGTWNGTGILDPNSGLFDPETAGLGFHEITYISPRGCVTLDTIEVFEFMQVSIDQVESVYCFKDSAVQVVLDPPGGEFFINGQSSIDVFNPKDLGPGSHELFYTRGNGACESTDRVFITVLLPIDGNASVTKDSICLGDNSVVMVSPTGGLGNLVSTWNKNLDFGTSHIVYPDVSTWYTVIVEDGCSDPYLDSVLVHVFPDFDIELEEGPEVCYGEQTYVEIITSNPADFQVQWLTDVPITGKRYDGLSGFYNVKVTQLSTGCSKDYTVELPGALPLKANFSLIPSNRCIDIIDNEIEIIDLATGYTDGTINFGDTSATISLITDELTNEYNEEGEYKITQIVTNDLGCIDSFSLWICVENKVRIYTPNIFTPNGDGENDFLKMYTYGLEEFEWSVFDRYGELVFKSNGPDDEWDGNFRGLEMVPQVFALKIKYKEKDRSFFVTQVLSVTLIR